MPLRRKSRNAPCLRHSRRGSVVIFVLGIILLAAFLITRLMDRAAVELAAEGKAAKRGDLRQEAVSALEASLAVLADEAAARSGLHDGSEGWDRPLALMDYQPTPGYTAETLVVDETGKLSLPVVDEETLRNFLTTIGCPATALDRLVDSLLVWTKPDYLPVEGEADGATFASASLPYAAPGRTLRSFAELRAIPAARELFFDEQGEWNELGRSFRTGASLFAFNASNVNSAPSAVLLTRGLDEARVAAIMAAREDKNSRSSYFHSAAEMAGAWGRDATPPGLGTEALCLHVIVTVKFGSRQYRLDAWVQPAGASTPVARRPAETDKSANAAKPPASVRNNPRKSMDYPFRILELRENDGT